jgi:ABC-2 type transport system permease protein
MWVIFKKEIRSFLGSFIAYIVIGVFLLLTGLFLWMIKGNNIFDLGVASLQVMFEIAPFILIFLVSAITMRSISEEKRLGTLEILTTKPIHDVQIILGKFLASVTLILIAIIPTLFYYYAIYHLASPVGNIDTGATMGSYIGLILLAACYASVGMFSSSLTDNQIVALITSMLLNFFFFHPHEKIF